MSGARMSARDRLLSRLLAAGAAVHKLRTLAREPSDVVDVAAAFRALGRAAGSLCLDASELVRCSPDGSISSRADVMRVARLFRAELIAGIGESARSAFAISEHDQTTPERFADAEVLESRIERIPGK